MEFTDTGRRIGNVNWRQTMYISLIFLFGLLFHTGQPASVGPNETNAVAVLFKSFETVFRTTPAVLSDSPMEKDVGIAWEPFSYLQVALEATGKRMYPTIVNNSEAVLLGTKDYLPPNGLGRVISTRCYISVMREGNTVDLSRYFNTPPVSSANGASVWNWTVNLGELGERDSRPSLLYITQIANKYILVSNNLEELEKVMGGLISSEKSTMPTGIREWDDVRRHEFWGYRKYRGSQSRSVDTTSAGTRGIKSDAEALILYVDIKHRTGVLRFLGSKVDDASVKSINAMRKIPPLQSVGPGKWETIFPLTADVGPFPESAFTVLWLFGLGVVV